MKLVLRRRDTLGLRLAHRLEDKWRDCAFIGDDYRICGIEVRPLTLRMFVELSSVRSPFIVGGVAGPHHVAQFIWRLSPVYDHRHTSISPTPAELAEAEELKAQLETLRQDEQYAEKADHLPALENAITALVQPTVRSRFMAGIRHLNYDKAVRSITRFIDRMLYDQPPQTDGAESKKSDVSFAGSIIHLMAKTYGWAPDQILDLPMPALFQHIRCIQRDLDPELPTFNPLYDRYRQRAVDKRNSALLAARAELTSPAKQDEPRRSLGEGGSA